MGIWDWVLDKVSGPAQVASSSAASRGNANGVATLDQAAEALNDDASRWWAPEDASLTEPSTLERPQLCAEQRALESLLIEHFDGHDLSLPPLPRVPEAVLRKLASRKYGLADVAEDIREDQVSAAAVLRLANSPLYRGFDKIIGVDPAVVRLGANAVRTLMMHQSMRSLAGSGKGPIKRRAEELSLRALAAASVMRALSRFTGMDPEEAFLVGLLHDIGAVIVLRIAADQAAFLRTDISREAFEFLCFETHQEFGELVADEWQLPEKLTTLISDHHAYPADDDPYRLERLQLELTDMIGALLGYAPYAPYDLLNTRAVADLGLADRPDFVDFLKGLPDELEDTMAAYA